MSDITWTTEKRKLGDLIEWDKNPRILSKHDGEHIKRSMEKFGLADPLVVNADNRLIGGHQRKHLLADADMIVDVRVPSRQLTAAEAEELAIRLNKAQGAWDFDLLANNWEQEKLIDWGFEKFEFGIETLESVGGMASGNYGDSSSKNTVPMNILGIGGLVPRDVMESVKSKLIAYGCDESNDNGDQITEIFQSWLEK